MLINKPQFLTLIITVFFSLSACFEVPKEKSEKADLNREMSTLDDDQLNDEIQGDEYGLDESTSDDENLYTEDNPSASSSYSDKDNDYLEEEEEPNAVLSSNKNNINTSPNQMAQSKRGRHMVIVGSFK